MLFIFDPNIKKKIGFLYNNFYLIFYMIFEKIMYSFIYYIILHYLMCIIST